jgi:hypothetical protein
VGGPANIRNGGQRARIRAAAIEGGGGKEGGGGRQSIAGALRGRAGMADFGTVHPKDLLAKASDLDVERLYCLAGFAA